MSPLPGCEAVVRFFGGAPKSSKIQQGFLLSLDRRGDPGSQTSEDIPGVLRMSRIRKEKGT